MTKTTDKNDSALKQAVTKTTRVHFAYVAAYIGSIVAFDSWNLVTHEGIVQRWQLAIALLLITTVAWLIARSNYKPRSVILGLVIADSLFAGFNVYWQRGMASKAVMLFAVPIITAAVLGSRRAILAAATLSSAVYSLAAVRYFHMHYGEGFKVELYGEIGLYSAVFFILASLLIIVVRKKS